MSTLTASLALPTYTPPVVHTGTTVSGKYTGAVSTSASGIVFLAKVPNTAKTVQLVTYHTGPETTMTINYGIRSGATTSTSVSAFVSDATINSTRVSNVVVPVEDSTLGESFKYVTASLQAGTKAASSTIYYTIHCSF